jgi:hypothetical protein
MSTRGSSDSVNWRLHGWQSADLARVGDEREKRESCNRLLGLKRFMIPYRPASGAHARGGPVEGQASGGGE